MPIYPSTRVIASPTLTGDPTAPTPTAGDGDTSVATTAFVTDAIATQAAADADTYAQLTDQRWNDQPLKIVTLMSAQGTTDETLTLNHCTIADDTTHYDFGVQGIEITAGSAGPGVYCTPSEPLTIGTDVGAFCMRIYLPDASKFTSLQLTVFSDAALTWATRWVRSTAATGSKPLVNGWNTIRFPAFASTRNATWGSVYQVRVEANGGTLNDKFTIGHVWCETRPKASLLFIDDGGYDTWYTTLYQELRARGIPCTIATDPALVGTSTSGKQRMTQAQLDEFADDDNGNSISIHYWGTGTATADMTADEVRADVLRTVKWCNEKGYTGGVWRAAYLGEVCPQAAAGFPYLLGSADYATESGPTCWPPVDRYNIPRYSIYQSRTLADIDAHFAILRDTHAVSLMFTHAVGPIDAYDMDATQMAHILSWIDTGLTAGWLEGVTFEDLFARSGGRIRPGFNGGQVADFIDEDGAQRVMRLP
jgi:hypothetical protein